jgi:hypothetical protein
MHLLKKPLQLTVYLLLLVALGLSEIPEHIRLSDDVSNDFVISAGGDQSVQARAISGQGPTLGSSPVEAVPAQSVQDSRFPSIAEPFHLAGQDRLLLWSIQRT